MQSTDTTDVTQLAESQEDGVTAEPPDEPEDAGQSASGGAAAGPTADGATAGRAPRTRTTKRRARKDAPAPIEQAAQGKQDAGLATTRRQLRYQSAEWALIETLGALRAAQPDNFPEIFPSGPAGPVSDEPADEEPRSHRKLHRMLRRRPPRDRALPERQNPQHQPRRSRPIAPTLGDRPDLALKKASAGRG